MASNANQKPRQLYGFGPFRIDPEKELLLREDQVIPIAPKALQVLIVLMRQSKQVFTKDDLLKKIWPDTFVEETNLSRNIFLVRKALGEREPTGSPIHRHRFWTGQSVCGRRQLVPERELDIVSASHAKVKVKVEESKPWVWIAVAAALVAARGVIALRFFVCRPTVLTEKDTVVLADFANSTGDPVFDITLRQGIAIQLEQSPFLSPISDQRVQQTLQLVGLPPDARLTAPIAHDLCQRRRSAPSSLNLKHCRSQPSQ